MSRYVNVCALGAPVNLHFNIVGTPETNQEALEKMIEFWRMQLHQVWPYHPDLIVLPEACDRYSAHSIDRRLDYYRYRGNQVRDYLAEEARAHHCYIAYSAHREMPDGTWRNATEMIDRQGTTAGMYHKNYLTRPEYEVNSLRFGKDAPLIQCDFGTVGFIICFDLNFEELRKRYKAQRPDIIALSSGPNAFDKKIWAYDCQAYFLAAMGGFLRSVVISPLGEIIDSTGTHHPFVTARINLDREMIHFDNHWKKLDAAKEKYSSKINIHAPHACGLVLLTSETDEFTAQDVMKEFGMISWREYYAASIKHREEHIDESRDS